MKPTEYFEYKSIRTEQPLTHELDVYGKDRWELVGYATYAPNSKHIIHSYVFKRKL